MGSHSTGEDSSWGIIKLRGQRAACRWKQILGTLAGVGGLEWKMDSNCGDTAGSREQKWEPLIDERAAEAVYDLSFAYKMSWDHPDDDIKQALHLLLCLPTVSEKIASKLEREERKTDSQGLSDEESKKVRWLIVRNPNTPPPVLDSFVNEDLEPMILERIAEHPRTCPSTLHKLASHPNPSVRAALAENTNTPVETLSLLVNDDHPDVRYRVAEGYHVPIDVLKRLTEDINPYVAQRAHQTLGRLSAHEVVTGDFHRQSKAKRSII